MSGRVLRWIKSWLADRRQWVVLNGKSSEWREVRLGMPQGSVLGPTLFLVYINDIDEAMEMTEVIASKFVDDTKVGRVVEGDDDRDRLQKFII